MPSMAGVGLSDPPGVTLASSDVAHTQIFILPLLGRILPRFTKTSPYIFGSNGTLSTAIDVSPYGQNLLVGDRHNERFSQQFDRNWACHHQGPWSILTQAPVNILWALDECRVPSFPRASSVPGGGWEERTHCSCQANALRPVSPGPPANGEWNEEENEGA